ncbi:MAG: hypothetical protein ACYC6Y_32030, partial [Thermoguttaceae bacterium]
MTGPTRGAVPGVAVRNAADPARRGSGNPSRCVEHAGSGDPWSRWSAPVSAQLPWSALHPRWELHWGGLLGENDGLPRLSVLSPNLSGAQMTKVRVAIHGAAGRMGRRLVALATADPELKLVAAVDSANHPELGA